MLSGRTLFEGAAAQAIMALHLSETAPPLCEVDKDIPEAVAMVVAKALAKGCENRYPNVDAFMKDFEAAVAGGQVEAASFRAKTSCAMPSATARSGRRWALAAGSTTGPRSPVSGRGTTGPRMPVGPRSTTGPVIAVGPRDDVTRRHAPVGVAEAGQRGERTGGKPSQPLGLWVAAGLVVALLLGFSVLALLSDGGAEVARDQSPEPQKAPRKFKKKDTTGQHDFARKPGAGTVAVRKEPEESKIPAVRTPSRQNAGPRAPESRPPRVAPPPSSSSSPEDTAPHDEASHESGGTRVKPKVKEPEAEAAALPPPPPQVDPPQETQVKTVDVKQDAPAQGPDPKIPALRARFLTVMRKATHKQDLRKAVEDLRKLAKTPPYDPVKDLISDDLALLAEAIVFEQQALKSLGEAKTEVELPENMARMAGAKKGKVKGYDVTRGLTVAVSQAEVTLTARDLSTKQIISASPAKSDPRLVTAYYLARADLAKVRALLPKLPDKTRAEMEKRVALLEAGEADVAAETAFTGLAKLVEQRQWEAFLPAAEAFAAQHGTTRFGKSRAKDIERWTEAANAAINPWAKVFHARTVKSLPNGFVQLDYDFSTPEQLEDFKSPGGKLEFHQGWLKAPHRTHGKRKWPHKPHMNVISHRAPLTELRAFSAFVKPTHWRRVKGLDKSSLGVCFSSNAVLNYGHSPACGYSSITKKIFANAWGVIDKKGRKRNRFRRQQIDFPGNVGKGLGFKLVRTGEEYRWIAGGRKVADFKWPPNVKVSYLVMGARDLFHSWRRLHLVFKPEADWAEKELNASKPESP
jgi:hypothetical protein